jgi:hypothetical protein
MIERINPDRENPARDGFEILGTQLYHNDANRCPERKEERYLIYKIEDSKME